jgi:hypothetical protein
MEHRDPGPKWMPIVDPVFLLAFCDPNRFQGVTFNVSNVEAMMRPSIISLHIGPRRSGVAAVVCDVSLHVPAAEHWPSGEAEPREMRGRSFKEPTHHPLKTIEECDGVVLVESLSLRF